MEIIARFVPASASTTTPSSTYSIYQINLYVEFGQVILKYAI